MSRFRRTYLKFTLTSKYRVWEKRFRIAIERYFSGRKITIFVFRLRINRRRVRDIVAIFHVKPETYEHLFGARLRRRGNKWRELVEAEIPITLQSLVESIVIVKRFRIG